MSCYHFQSTEPFISCDNYGEVLYKEHANSRALFADHTSDCVFAFIHASFEGEQIVDAKHKFETFSKNCGFQIKHYHAEKLTLNS